MAPFEVKTVKILDFRTQSKLINLESIYIYI